MSEFNIRADAVDVEQIMRQIRARIRDKRGVDYTEEQIQELARVRLEKFLDPKGLRSDLLQQFQQSSQSDVPPLYEFDDQTLFRSSNPLVAFVRRLMKPILKLFFSPNPLIQALHQQTQLNRYLMDRAARDILVYEVLHNLVVEMTRTGIEVKNMQMRVESVSGRLDFNERRARALEAVVQYRPDAVTDRAHGPASGGGAGDGGPSGVDPITGGESLRSRRRRRRRGRRSGAGFTDVDERRAQNDERRADSDEKHTGRFEQPTTRDEARTQNSEPRGEGVERQASTGPGIVEQQGPAAVAEPVNVEPHAISPEPPQLEPSRPSSERDHRSVDPSDSGSDAS
jgi:hypothetical protein